MGPVTFNFAVLSSQDKSLQHTGRKKKSPDGGSRSSLHGFAEFQSDRLFNKIISKWPEDRLFCLMSILNWYFAERLIYI